MIKPLTRIVTLLSLLACGCTQSASDPPNESATRKPDTTMQQAQLTSGGKRFSIDDIEQVSPVLADYTQETLQGEVWDRPGLSKRDRSLVTLAALIAGGQPWLLEEHIDRALDHGVKPAEISELITHLAFYSGWGNAMAPIEPTRKVFAERNIGQEQLAAAKVDLLPLDEQAEAQRATFVEATYSSVSPGVVQYTTDPLFRELWLRPDLAPRDRSLVTVSALVASGHSEQVTFHLNRAMDNGLTQEEASEVLTQLACYAGWPRVFSAMPVVKEVFASRQNGG